MMSKAGMEIAQEAFEKGREEGREEGLAKALLRLLEGRFQSVPDEVRAKVAGASSEELDRWLARGLDAKSLEELFAEP